MDAIKILGSLLASGALTKGDSGGNILGSLVGAALGGSSSTQTQGGGMLGDLLGSVLGGNNASQSSSGGGLGSLLGSVLGGGSSQQSGGGGLGDLLGSVLGGSSRNTSQSSGGGLGDLLGSVLGGGGNSGAAQGGALEDLIQSSGLGGLLGGALVKHAQTIDPDAPTPMPDDNSMLPADLDPQQANEQAMVLIRAMLNAAKADGEFDEAEQEAILSKLGDATEEEIEFIRNELSKPLDIDRFANEVPRGMERQIYTLSLSAIDLDKQSEADYLGQLAQALRIDPQEANAIHEQLGAPTIFA